MHASYLRMAASSRVPTPPGTTPPASWATHILAPGRPDAPAGVFGFLGALYAAQHVQQIAHPAAR